MYREMAKVRLDFKFDKNRFKFCYLEHCRDNRHHSKKQFFALRETQNRYIHFDLPYMCKSKYNFQILSFLRFIFTKTTSDHMIFLNNCFHFIINLEFMFTLLQKQMHRYLAQIQQV